MVKFKDFSMPLSVFKYFSWQISFSRTFQDSPVYSSTFQACANPDINDDFERVGQVLLGTFNDLFGHNNKESLLL